MKIFLDTSLLSDPKLAEISAEIGRRRLEGDEFYVSVITHFELTWGYLIAGRSSEKYEAFLNMTRIDVVALSKTDAEEAASARPDKRDVLDSLVAASAKRLDAIVWTVDRDFLKYLTKSKVRIFR